MLTATLGVVFSSSCRSDSLIWSTLGFVGGFRFAGGDTIGGVGVSAGLKVEIESASVALLKIVLVISKFVVSN